MTLSVEEKRARLAQLLREKASQRTYPLSFSQERLWFLEQLEPESPLYNLFTVLRLQGALEVAVLHRAVNELAKRHEALRTVFVLEDGTRPAQRILPDITIPLEVVDLRTMPPAEREAETRRLIQQEARQSFNLTDGALLRTRLLWVEDDVHLALLNMHHIITDGWSVNLFIGEMAALYHAFAMGQPSPLRPLTMKYADFALWQRQTMQGEALARHVAYWKNQLTGAPPLLELPTDRPRPPVQHYHGANHHFTIPAPLTSTVKHLSQQEGVTPFMTLLAAFKVLLYRYSGQQDIVVGSPIANRTRAELEGLIGFFVNTLVLRSDLSGNPSFRALLQRVRQMALDAYAHQELSFEQVVEAVQPPRNLSHSPLFQVMFVLQNTPKSTLRVAGLTVQQEEIESTIAKFDLTLILVEQQQRWVATVEYNRDLFDHDTITRLCDHFQVLLGSIVAQPDAPIAALPLLSEAHRRDLLTAWNPAPRALPDSALLHERIGAIAMRYPDRVAVRSQSEEISYSQLDYRANQIAQHLQQQGIGTDSFVALYMERSIEMLVGLVAILKAGGAYVPLDPTYPAERLRDMLTDAAPRVLLTQKQLAENLPPFDGEVLYIEDVLADEPLAPLTPRALPSSLAYMIYTSGSTGKPKGVMVTHDSVVNLLYALDSAIPTIEGIARNVSVNGSVSFDTSVKQIIQLAHGDTLDVTPSDIRFDGAALLDCLHDHRITVFDCTPSQLRVLLSAGLLSREGLALEAVLVGGEPIDEPLWAQLAAAPFRFYNVYGPTECTVDSTLAPIMAESSPTLGYALPNTRLYILDGQGQPVPIGVAGELHIGGHGVARGYYGRADATADKFIPDPFGEVQGARLYKSGDLVRHRPNGTIEFLGRVDDQVKIRGFRIELGEIEAVLTQHPAVTAAAVAAHDHPQGGKRLVGYVVGEVNISTVRAFLREQLPDYMIPALFVRLEALPLTPNGKINRRALPIPDTQEDAEERPYVAPRTPTEAQLTLIWEDLLGMGRIGIYDNFFERGGHSLLATQLMARIRATLQSDLPLRTLFQTPTIAGLAQAIAGGSTADYTPIAPREQQDAPLLSFAQERLWFLDQLEPNSPFYNIPVALRLQGAVDSDLLTRALNEVVRRHESLRTAFAIGAGGIPTQHILPELWIPLVSEDLRDLPPALRANVIRQRATMEAQQPFALSDAPLLRGRLLWVEEQEYIALLTLHHSITDGWSTNILVSELASLYSAFAQQQPSPLPDLPIQYADFALWQRAQLQGELLEQQIGYWKKALAAAPPILELPTDRPRPPVQSFRGAHHAFSIEANIADGLKQLSRQEGVTLFMTLLAAFKVLLSRYSGQQDVVVGTPIANRTRAEVEGLIGFFVNTLVLRSDLSSNPTFRALLQQVRQNALDAYAHQELPFEQVVEAVQPPRNLSHSPLFQVMFVLQNTPRTVLEVAGMKVQAMEVESGIAKFDLTLTMAEQGQGLSAVLEYNRDLFDPATIERMGAHLHTLLAGIVAAPAAPIADLPLLGKAERHELLRTWNANALDFPRERALHQWFEAQAARTPDAVAVRCDHQPLTYAQLDARANQVAHRLQQMGIGSEDFVGICMKRSSDMLVSLLGVLKAGGAYAPLDPAYPAERLAFIVQNARVQAIITQVALQERLPETTAQILCIDDDAAIPADTPTTAPTTRVTAAQLAYVIYTSGSTGQPKGVAISHANAGAMLAWGAECFSDAELAGMLASTSINFDLSVYELFLPLSRGGTVLIADDMLHLPTLAARDAVTLVNTVPSVLSEYLKVAELPVGVQTVNLAGEPLPLKLVRHLYEQTPVEKVYNLYGPSEDTTYSTWALIARGDHRAPTIGRAIANSQLYLLDSRMQPVPIGVAGELYLGGEGVTRGYLHQPSLTADKFIPDPFSDSAGARLYKTGDVARFRPDGSVDFLGRRDHQVKVRGFRIELGEIEAVLARHPAVHEAAVMVREDAPGDKRIVAYVVSKAEADATPPTLRAFLQIHLPPHMIPTAWVALAALPLTPNGKIDRRALPAPDAARGSAEGTHTAPRTEREAQLAALWAEILRVEEVGVEDNFFELGGHSLLATQIVARARSLFQVELPVRALFEAPTVAGLAQRIEVAQPTIGKAEVAATVSMGERTAPLSFAQERLWFLDQLEPESPFYNVLVPLQLRGTLHVDALMAALHEVIRRHEALRTVFGADAQGKPMQQVLPSLTLHLEVDDLRHLTESEQQNEIRHKARHEVQQPFHLNHAPLLRARLLQLADEAHVALLTFHHIITDGWSTNVLIGEIAALYPAFVRGEPSPLAPLALQYPDFAIWQRGDLQGEVLERQVGYWKQQLADAPPLLELPTDYPRPATQSFYGANYHFTLPTWLTTALKQLSRQEGVTLFMTLLAAFKVLLYRYSGQSDILVGSPIANRTRTEIEALIGFFVNTLVLRSNLADAPDFLTLVRRVRDVTLDAYAHQELPFEHLVDALQPPRSLAHPPLFQVLFVLQNSPRSAMDIAGLTVEPLLMETSVAKFDLTLTMEESQQGLIGALEYNIALFDRETIVGMAEHFQTLLSGIIENPQQSVATLPLFDATAHDPLLTVGYGEVREYPLELTLSRWFEAQAAQTPHASAVEYEAETLSYAELNARANQLAAYLQAVGVGKEARVGIGMYRAPDMVVALLAVLKVGAAYIPFDPDYPAERLAYMAADSGVRVMLTTESLTEATQAYAPDVQVLALDTLQLGEYSSANLTTTIDPDHAAYVLYTSGSTGRPKGVVIPHRAIANHMRWMIETYGFTAETRVLQKTAFGFDASVWEFYAPLLAGGTLVLAVAGGHQDSGYMAALMAERAITTAQFVPSMLSLVVDEACFGECHALRQVFCGGEVLTVELRDRFYRRVNAELHNLYGPTETTIDVTAWHCRPHEPTVPIGKPIANTRLYLLDSRLQPVPIGVQGELYVGGAGVGRGYLNRPDLTAEKFIPDPFSQTGERLYKTGDVVRARRDGAIEFVGRVDHQIKLRGFRIELGEIEAVLAQHPAVRASAVVVREANGVARLVAYLAPHTLPDSDDATLAQEAEVRAFLKTRLPAHMIPSAWVWLESLPHMPNGKVDRRALPTPSDEETLRRPYIAPRTSTEQHVAKIWQEVLGVAQVGVEDDFFESGGQSLLATQAVSRIRSRFQVEFPLRTLFEAPTVAGLARYIEEVRHRNSDTIYPIPHDGTAPLAFAQERLWFLDQLEPNSPLYNVLTPMRLAGMLDSEILSRALNEVVQRHDSLRTIFGTDEAGQPIQRILAELPITLTQEDMSVYDPAEREDVAQQRARTEAQQPFDLATGPLIRAHLLRFAEDDHLALLTMHHIITDGWSMGIFIQELATCYAAFAAEQPSPLPDLPIQYPDVAYWQRDPHRRTILEGQLDYWKAQLADAPPLLELPTDRARPPVQSFRGATVTFVLSAALTTALKKVSQQEGATLFMTLLTAFKVLLSRYSGARDVVVGSPIANRTRTELESLIGFFVNTLVLRTEIDPALSFREALARVRQSALDAYANQDVPFEQVVDAVQPPRNLSHSPLFQVMFALQNTPRATLTVAGLSVQPLEVESGIAKFDLTLTMVEQQTGLNGILEYNRDLFDRATMERMSAQFQTLLAYVVEHMGDTVQRLPLLPTAERDMVAQMAHGIRRALPNTTLAHEWVAQWAAATPDALAVAAQGEALTYADLNRRATQLAHYLQSLGVKAEVPVALCLPRSLELVVAVVAVLKAGGAYVPLDPTHPAERLAWMVADTRTPVVLTHSDFADYFAAGAATVLCLNQPNEAVKNSPTTDVQTAVTAANLAYLIYTSGSTGLPKGTELTHAGLLNLIHWHCHTFTLTAADRMSMVAGVGFDAAVWELLPVLVAGASVHLPDEESRLAPEQLRDWLTAERISIAFLPTPLAERLVMLEWAADTALRTMLTGGDRLTISPPPNLPFALVNNYGPTENTVVTTSAIIPASAGEGAPSIGRAIDNNEVWLLDGAYNPVPIGVVGELYIGGDSLARGYLNRPALTAAAFIPHPFSDVAGARLYKTADLARYRTDGQIDFIGRRDHQIKVRGFRIELGEIEAVLAQYPTVREVAVQIHTPTQGEPRIVAYVVQEGEHDLNALRSFLQSRLPSYMIPTAWVEMAQLPLTPNGKVDRRALPLPQTDEAAEAFVAPRTLTEQRLALLWAHLLRRERVGIYANFFEVGGHSLMAVQLMARIEQEFGYRLPLAALFQYPTIAGLAAHLEQQRGGAVEEPCLIPLQAGDGRGAPLFLVHPVGGTIFPYLPLVAHLPAEATIYGLQAPTVSDDNAPLASVEAMATHYIEQIKAVQPSGAYQLGGWSMGGVVAYEMAQQLRAQGETVSLLALLDSYIPQRQALTDLSEESLLATFAQDMGVPLARIAEGESITDGTTEARLAGLLALAQQQALVPPDVSLTQVYALYRTFRHHVALLSRYVALPYEGAATLLQAAERGAAQSSAADSQAWDELATEGCTIHPISGSHFSMMRPPHVASLAAQLSLLFTDHREE